MQLGMSASEFLSVPFKYERIINGLGPCELGLLVSLAGTGKTTLALNLLISLAAGKTFFPFFEAGTPRRVLFVDSENSAPPLQRDLSTMLGDLTPHERKHVDQNLCVVVDAQIDGNPFRLSTPEHLTALTTLCKQHKPELIVIDTVSATFDVTNENDNAEVNRVVIRSMQKLLKDCGAAGLLLHHIGKVGEGDGSRIYASRGASVLPAFARLVLTLSRDKRTNDCVILTSTKIKGPSFDDVVLRLNREKRWFEVLTEKQNDAVGRASNYRRVVDLITEELTRKEINALALGIGISSATVGRELSNAHARNEIVKVGRGRYARRTQIAGETATSVSA